MAAPNQKSKMYLFLLQFPRFSRILLGIVFVWTCGVLFPAFPNVIGMGLDPSWEHALNLAHAQGLIFGKDIVFTYGPLAYLGYPDARTVDPIAVLVWNLSIYSVSIYFLVKVIRLCRSTGVALAMLVVLSFAAAFKFGFGSTERLQIAFLLASWVLAVDCTFENTSAYIWAGILAGISLLIKVNDGVVNLAVFYAIYSCGLWRAKVFDRRAITLALIPLAVFCLVFRLVNGPLTMIVSYLQSSLLIGSGYSEGMAIVGSTWQVALALIGVFLLVLILATKVQKIPYCILIPTVLLSWATFKHCMVRQDGHAVPFHAELAAISGFGLLAATGKIKRGLLIGLSIANLCCALVIAHFQTPEILTPILRFLRAGPLSTDLVRYAHLKESWKVLEAGTDAVLSPRRADPGITQLVGRKSVDDLTWNVDFIFANHFRWNPRPIFQSYAAYEPSLDRINAMHLHRDGADFLSLKFEAVDGRHPFLDDVSTWREVFDRYDIEGGGLEMLLLGRRREHRFSALRPVIGVRQAHWGEEVAIPLVPNDQVVVMKASVNRSIWGIFRESAFRLDPTYIEVKYRSGATAKYRITRPNLVNGAIISYLPQSLPEMFPLFGYGGAAVRNPVATIRWVSSSREQFSNPIELSWSAMTLKDSRDDRRLPFFHPDTSSFISLWKPKDGAAGTLALQTQADDAKLTLRPTNDDPQVLLRASQSLARFNSILIRARFSVSDQINMFFGQQGNGRGFGGYVPIAGQWIDIYVKVGSNPFWKNEVDSLLRFDPVTSRFHNSRIELAGIWGSTRSLNDKPGEMSFYLTQSGGALAP